MVNKNEKTLQFNILACSLVQAASEVLLLEPLDNTSPTVEDEPPEEQSKPGMFESDIRLVDEQKRALESLILEEESDDDDQDEMMLMEKRKAIGNLSNRWPYAVVPYVIDASITGTSAIMKAIEHWEYHTCIRFKPMTDQLVEEIGHSDHVVFEKGTGFWSYVGRVGIGAQTISIGDENRAGSIAHEIGHTIGFWHEQGRPDRDEYQNVSPGFEDAFKKYDWEETLTHDIPYDVGSIMHYGAYYFSHNGLPTIIAKNSENQDKLGNRMTLSRHDIKLANLMYDCPDTSHCTNKKGSCDNWASKGFCETGKYVGFMLGNCAKSCDLCHECKDKNNNCGKWAKSGFCDSQKYGHYMKSHCIRACGICTILDDTPQ
ncbi:protein SpAN-like [Amphiura filiformis]|uniref:protein SpAN-like n=1 Tax=Amphiura filiformis TaxID=82378 RepID=UPI003B218B94